MVRFMIGIVLTGALVSLTSTARADAGAEQVYESLFGEQVRRALGTGDSDDDIEVAGKMVSVARTVEDKDLKSLLLDKSVEMYARHPESVDRAIETLQAWAELDATREASLEDRMLAIYKQPYLRASGAERKRLGAQYLQRLLNLADDRLTEQEYDEAINYYKQALPVAVSIQWHDRDGILAQIALAEAKRDGRKKFNELKEQFTRTPTSATLAMKLYRVALLELDDPVEAMKYIIVARVPDGEERVATLAARPINELTPKQRREVGRWYESLEKRAPLGARPIVRAKAKHYKQAAKRTNRRRPRPTTDTPAPPTAPKTTENKPAATAPTSSPESATGGDEPDTATDHTQRGTIDLLRLIDVEEHARIGKWTKRSGRLVSEETRGSLSLRMPGTIAGNYQFELSIQPDAEMSKYGYLRVYIPLAKGRGYLQINGNRDPTVSMLGSSEHFKGALSRVRFEPGKTHYLTFRIEDSDAEVEISIDFQNREIFQNKIRKDALLQSSDADRLDVMTYGGSMTLKKATLRLQGGSFERD